MPSLPLRPVLYLAAFSAAATAAALSWRGGRSRLPDPVTAAELFTACAADPSAHAGRELTVTGVATGGRDLGAPGRPPHLLLRGPGPRQAVRCLFVPGADLSGVRFGRPVSVRGTLRGPSTDTRLQGAE